MSKHILDTSAVLAYLFDETGAEQVAPVFEAGNAVISNANLAELISKLFDQGMPESAVKELLDNLEMKCMPLTEDQAFITGALRPLAKPFGLSLDDRACIALGMLEQLPVLTADAVWIKMDVDCEIKLIR